MPQIESPCPLQLCAAGWRRASSRHVTGPIIRFCFDAYQYCTTSLADVAQSRENCAFLLITVRKIFQFNYKGMKHRLKTLLGKFKTQTECPHGHGIIPNGYIRLHVNMATWLQANLKKNLNSCKDPIPLCCVTYLKLIFYTF